MTQTGLFKSAEVIAGTVGLRGLWELESDCLLPSDCRDHAPSLVLPEHLLDLSKQTEEDEFGSPLCIS
jgi:hypothetical protein